MVVIATYPSHNQLIHPCSQLFSVSREQLLRLRESVLPTPALKQIDQWISQGAIHIDDRPQGGWNLGMQSDLIDKAREYNFDLIQVVTQWVRLNKMEYPRTRGPKETYTLGYLPDENINIDSLSQAASDNEGKSDAFLDTVETEKRRVQAALQPRFGHNSLQRGQFWNRNPDYDPMDDDDDP